MLPVLITGTDEDGDALGRPLEWDEAGPPPLILMQAEARGAPALAPGQRVLSVVPRQASHHSQRQDRLQRHYDHQYTSLHYEAQYLPQV